MFEVVWAVGLKYTNGFTKPYPTFLTLIAMLISFLLLSQSLKTLPIGTAYAVWTGIGAVGTVVYGIFFLGESANLLRLGCIALVIIAMIGLKLTHS